MFLEVNEEKIENTFRAVVKYSKQFPKLFDLGDMDAVEENIVYSMLGEIRDRYSPDGIVFSYNDIAYMAGLVRYDNRRNMYYARTGKEFNKIIEKLEKKLRTVSYQKIKSMDKNGEISKYDSVFLFDKRFSVDHEEQTLTVFISNEVIQDTILDESGEIIQERFTVADLFNSDDWRKTIHLQYGREFHNALRKKYAKRLYRWLSEFRTYGYAKLSADVFEKKILKLTTASLQKKKKQIIDDAVEELKKMTYGKDEDGNDKSVIGNLTLERIYSGRSLTHYRFTFQHFTIDLNDIDSISGKEVMFNTTKRQFLTNGEDGDDLLVDVLKAFTNVFGTDPTYNNDNNKRFLKNVLSELSKEVVIEAIERTGIDSRRGFGWTRRLLENWKNAGIKTLDDVSEYEIKKFGNSRLSNFETNVPEWSNPDYKTPPATREEIIGLQVLKFELSFHRLTEEEITLDNIEEQIRKLSGETFREWVTKEHQEQTDVDAEVANLIAETAEILKEKLGLT